MQKFFIGLLVVTSLSVLLALFGFVASGMMLNRVTREFTPVAGDTEVCTALEKEKKNPSQESAQLPPNLNPSEIISVEVYPKTLREFKRENRKEVGKTSSFLTCPGLVEALDGSKLDQLKVFCPCKRGRLASGALALLTCIIQLALNVAVVVTVFILKKLTDVKKIWMINSILFGVCLLFCAISLVLAVQFNMKDSPDDLERVFAPSLDPNVDGLVYIIWICMNLTFCLIALIILLVLKILSKSAKDGDRRSTVASNPSNTSKGGASGASSKSRGTRSSSRGKSRTNKNAVAPQSQSQTPSGVSVKKNPSNQK